MPDEAPFRLDVGQDEEFVIDRMPLPGGDRFDEGFECWCCPHEKNPAGNGNAAQKIWSALEKIKRP